MAGAIAPHLYDYSPYSGGAGVIERIMRRQCHRQLTKEQAAALWAECRIPLNSNERREVTQEIEQSLLGALEDFPRDRMLDTLSVVLIGRIWPKASVSKELLIESVTLMGAEFNRRGYAEIPVTGTWGSWGNIPQFSEPPKK